MSDPKSWLEKRALDAALLIYTGKLGLTEDAQEECEGFAYVIEAVAREFAERAIACRELQNAMENMGMPSAPLREITDCYSIEIAEAIKAAEVDE